MTFFQAALLAASCAITAQDPAACVLTATSPPTVEAAVEPQKSGEATDVVLSAKAALVWDVESGKILYSKDANVRRPIASLSKLLSVLVIRDQLALSATVPIPPDVKFIQAKGAHIRLPVGQHASVQELLAASLIASANDAVVTLATATAGSEAAFVEQANQYAKTHHLPNTQLANATGLSGGDQFSTAEDVRKLLTRVYGDPHLAPLLGREKGTLTTLEGTRRVYLSTNELLGTYLPIDAAKTGYTAESGENIAIITHGASGQKIGAVVLGSNYRFQDMKVLVEWIWRNYSWAS